MRYDTLRSTAASDFNGPAVCLESDDGLDTTATDEEDPASGAATFYLIRAENDCSAGQGPLGHDSSGQPRTGQSCP
jgi:hypothetical protein